MRFSTCSTMSNQSFPNQELSSPNYDNIRLDPQSVITKKKSKDEIIRNKRIHTYTHMNIFKFLLAMNPNENASIDNTSLQKAKECLQKACEVAKDTAPLYLIDLDRIHISFKEPKLAQKVFMKTKRIPGLSARNKQYLYEQWAIFKLGQTGEDEEELEEIREDAKELFKMSVKACAEVNSKSEVAYFRLKEGLDMEIKQQRDPGVRRQLLQDIVYLQKLVGQYDEAITSLLTWLEDDPNDIDFLWNMVAIYNKQETYDEALEWLAKAMKHQDVLTPDKRELAIEVTTRVADLSSSRSENLQIDKLFSQLHFQTSPESHLQKLMGSLSISSYDKTIVDVESHKSSLCSGGAQLDDVLYDKRSAQIKADMGYHIVIIGYNRFDDVIQFAEKAFNEVGLNFFTHTTDNHSDVPNGVQSAQYVKKVLERCMSLVIHPEVSNEDVDEVDNSELCLVVDEAIRTHPSHSCCLVSGRTCINVLHKSLPSEDMTKFLKI